MSHVHLATWVASDPDVLGGTPCFKGSRVPIRVLFEHIAGGSSLDQFLADFDWLDREAVSMVLAYAKENIEDQFNREST